MANTYNLTLTNGTPSIIINEKEVIFDHGVTFTGRGVEDYGEHRNTNLLHLAENFANDTQPVNPLAGQVWFDTTSNTVRIYDGVGFISVGTDNYVAGVGEDPLATPAYNVSSNQVGLKRVLDAFPFVFMTFVAQYDTLDNHINLASAHDADQISFNDLGVAISANDIQEAIEDASTYLNDHITAGPAPGDSAHDAADITFNSAPVSFTASDVQEALEDLDARRSILGSAASLANTSVNNHINDVVAAHAATAISYDNTSTGLTATNVQAAIDEIAAIGSTGGGAGIVDYVRTFSTSNISIPSGPLGGAFGTWTTVPFNSIHVGDDLSNFNTGTFRYVADRPMEVRIRAYARYEDLGDNQYGNVRILKNGATVLRRGYIIKKASSVNFADQTIEVSVIDELNTNDFIEVQGSIQSFEGGFTGNKNILAGRQNTGFEVEVLRDNSP